MDVHVKNKLETERKSMINYKDVTPPNCAWKHIEIGLSRGNETMLSADQIEEVIRKEFPNVRPERLFIGMTRRYETDGGQKRMRPQLLIVGDRRAKA